MEGYRARRNDEVPPELVFNMFKESADSGGNFQPVVRPWSLTLRTRQAASENYGLELQFDENESGLAASNYIKQLVGEYQKGEKDFAEMPLALYQLWVLQDWRREHNTPEAADYFSRKIHEEIREFCEEAGRVPPMLAQERFDSPLADLPYETDSYLKSELGDVLFTHTAGASMMAIDTERAAAHALLESYGYANKFPTIGEIDQAVLKGMGNAYMPEIPQPLEHETPVIYWQEHSPNFVLHTLGNMLTFKLQDLADVDMVMQPGHPEADRLAPSVGQLWVHAAVYARVWANSSLKEVIEENIAKIAGRVEEGSLEDKTLRSKDTN